MPEAADIERVAGALVDVAIRQSNITSALWKEIADSQTEAELASDTEDGARSSSRRNVVLLSRLERTSAQSRRFADEQVRALTELFLLWRNASRPSQLENPNRRRSLADTPLSSSPVTRSATLPSGQPVRQYALPLTDGRNTPASVRRPRHINTLERIDSHTDDTISQAPHSHTQSGRTEINVPSPRSLQRAKSSVSVFRPPVSQYLY